MSNKTTVPNYSYSSPHNDQEDAGGYPYNGKVLLAAVILLSIVILFVVLLHVYARWFLGRRRPPIVAHVDVADTINHHVVLATGGGHDPPTVSRGLDAKLVASLPTFVHTRREDGSGAVGCVVCLSPMEEGEKGRVLPQCKHKFHIGCIGTWLMSHSTCPICRSSVVAGEAVVVTLLEDEVVVQLLSTSTSTAAAAAESDDAIAAAAASEVAVAVPHRGSSTVASQFIKSSSSSSSSSSSNSSLKRMVSKSRSESRVFPSVLDHVM